MVSFSKEYSLLSPQRYIFILGEHARKRVLRVTQPGSRERPISKNVHRKEESRQSQEHPKSRSLQWQQAHLPPRGERSRRTYRLRHGAGVRGTRSTPAPSPRTAASRWLRQLCNLRVSVRHSSNMFLWSYMIGQAPPAQISIRRREKGRHWIQLAAFCLPPDSPLP